jgi:hypothetical protein
MTIKVADLPTSSKMEIISVRATYRTSQSPMNASSSKNTVGHEIVNRPHICIMECEFQLLVRVIIFDSIPQLFQLVDEGFQHLIEFWSRIVRTRYHEAKKHKSILHAKRRRKIIWNSKHEPAGIGCCIVSERCQAISCQPNANISRIPSKLWIKVV